jgi:hypothetical protein
MLSKEVKRRRRIKRELRKQPAWRTVMQAMKDAQLSVLKFQRNSIAGARAGATVIPTRRMGLTSMEENLATSLRVKKQRTHMTRQEWYEELAPIYKAPRRFSMRMWAERIVAVHVEREEKDKKEQKKFRRVYKQHVAKRKAAKQLILTAG